MKTPILFVVMTALALSSVPLASAQDKGAPAKPETSMQMDAETSQLQENMTKMQSQIDKIHATTDPKARQKLMQEHMQTMQDNMAMIGQMNKPVKADGSQGAGMAMGGDKAMAGGKGMMGGDMMQRHQMMEQRMEMMHRMMEQMLQHQRAMESMTVR